MTVNKELLRRTMDAVPANPELHNQKLWATQTDCGTAYCFAGWACKLSGFEADFEFLEPNKAGVIDAARLVGGDQIDYKASQLLGLDWWSAECLFAAENTTADLKELVDEICENGHVLAQQDPWSAEA